MKTIFALLTLFSLMLSSSLGAAEVSTHILGPGSSVEVRAGEEMKIYCSTPTLYDKCTCELEMHADGDKWFYVVNLLGVPVFRDLIDSPEKDHAGSRCVHMIKSLSACPN